MKKININTNNCNFDFICDAKANRSGFYHKVDLFINNVYEGAAKIQYYNRTWEWYDYQTACLNALGKVIKEYVTRNIAAFKELYGYKKMTQKRRQDFDLSMKNNLYYSALQACRDNLLHTLH